MTAASTIVYDIEVAGLPWEEVDEITRGYLLGRQQSEEDKESVRDRTALFPGLGKVVAIGMWLVQEDRGLLLLDGDSEPEHEWEKVQHSKIQRGSEEQLLARFWQIVGSRAGRARPRLVTFNGRGYDGPMLMIRSSQLGIAPSRNLLGHRYNLNDHCDLFDVLTFQGATRDRYSLDYWCRRFDVESPKGSIDGSQVAKAYRAGRILDIGEYCLRDVRATAQLFAKLEGTLLPLLGGS